MRHKHSSFLIQYNYVIITLLITTLIDLLNLHDKRPDITNNRARLHYDKQAGRSLSQFSISVTFARNQAWLLWREHSLICIDSAFVLKVRRPLNKKGIDRQMHFLSNSFFVGTRNHLIFFFFLLLMLNLISRNQVRAIYLNKAIIVMYII